MMKETAFELTESSRLTEVDTADARRRWRAGDGAFWIDLTECSPGDLETILDELNVGGYRATSKPFSMSSTWGAS
jgi:hypothetical protein